MFLLHVTSLNRDKDHHDFYCVYCGGEWLNKLQFSDHRFKGCPYVPINPIINKPIFILVLPNLVNALLLKKLKWNLLRIMMPLLFN
jgi:hypothetical protein